MKASSLLLCLCAAALLSPSACIGQQQCDTSAFTYNKSTGVYYMPGGYASATLANQCSCLQQQWNTINQEIQAQHEECLHSNQGQPENPNSGSYPGSSCSYSSCQSLHDALFTTMAPKEQQQIAACNAAVAQYQAEVQAQQAALQQKEMAAQVAQQQRAAELQGIKQQIAVLLNQQDAAALMATLLQQQTRSGQPDDSATPQNQDASAAANNTPQEVSSSTSQAPGAYDQVPPGNLVSDSGATGVASSDAEPPADSSKPTTADLAAYAKSQLGSVVTPELQGAIGDAAYEVGKEAAKDWVQQSGAYGELLVGATQQAFAVATETSNFVQQSSDLVDVFAGKTSPEQTSNILFRNFQQLGAQMLSNTVAGTLFTSGSNAIWNASSITLGNLDKEMSIVMSDGPYNAAELDQLSDPTPVAQALIFGMCSYCQKAYNAQRILSGEWALLSTKFGWNVSNDN